MRSRNIKPGFFQNEELSSLPADARLLFIGLWCVADREGRLEDRPRRIKAQLFPYTNTNVDNLLSKLEGARFIGRYEAEGGEYIVIHNFKKHQTPHPKEKPSEIPAPGDIAALHGKTVTSKRQDSDKQRTSPSDVLIPDVLIPDTPLPNTEPPPTPPKGGAAVDNELLDELLMLAGGVKSNKSAWQPSKADRKTLEALTDTFPPEQLRTEMGKFKAYAPQKDWTQFGRAFASWMGRVKPNPMVPDRLSAREQRIQNAVTQLRAGASEDVAKNMVNGDGEWLIVKELMG